jgi:hypothetical protein
MKTLMLVAVFALSATVASAENVPLPQPRPTEADMAYQATQDAWSNLIGREDPDKPAVVAEVDKPAATIADSDKPAPVMEEKVTKPGGIGSDPRQTLQRRRMAQHSSKCSARQHPQWCFPRCTCTPMEKASEETTAYCGCGCRANYCISSGPLGCACHSWRRTGL